MHLSCWVEWWPVQLFSVCFICRRDISLFLTVTLVGRVVWEAAAALQHCELERSLNVAVWSLPIPDFPPRLSLHQKNTRPHTYQKHFHPEKSPQKMGKMIFTTSDKVIQHQFLDLSSCICRWCHFSPTLYVLHKHIVQPTKSSTCRTETPQQKASGKCEKFCKQILHTFH